MLDLRVNLNGIQVAERHLEGIQKGYPSAVKRGLSHIVRGVYAEAFKNLGGAGAISKSRIKGKALKGMRTGFTKKSGETVNFKLFTGAGKYPVPVRTGNLRRLLNFVEPGQTKSAGGVTVHAGPNEAIIYNSAEYSRVIHEGTGSSAKYGPRKYLLDALDRYKDGEMAAIIENEMKNLLTGRG